MWKRWFASYGPSPWLWNLRECSLRALVARCDVWPGHWPPRDVQDHYEGEGNEGPPSGSEGEDGGPPIDIDPIDPDPIDYPDPEETMMEVSVAEIANVRMLLEEALDALPLTEGFNPETEPGPDYPGPDYPGPDYPEPELPVTFDKQFEL